MVHSYYIDDKKEVKKEELEELGVLQWQLDADKYQEDGKLDEIRKERSYKNFDVVCSLS